MDEEKTDMNYADSVKKNMPWNTKHQNIALLTNLFGGIDKKKIATNCINLVKNNILWNRDSNISIPKYTHSIRLYELLKTEKCAFHIQIAWLLHDILEDSSLTKNDLIKIWVPDKSIKLVELVSHDTDLWSAKLKWESKIKKLINQQDKEARLIAVADMLDNMKEPIFIWNEEKMRWYLSSKVAVMIYYASIYLKDSNIYKMFLNEYISLVKSLNNYDFIKINK